MPPQRVAKIHEKPRAWRFIRGALLLRCPECGISPIFKPLRQTRSLFDYFEPLDGCPRCGRERP